MPSVTTFATGVTGITTASQTRITAASEEKIDAAKRTLMDNLEKIQGQGNAKKLDALEEGDTSVSYYHDVISQFTNSSATKDKNEEENPFKTRLSRRQLFQRQGSSCTDVFVDVINDVFYKPEDRQVLIPSSDIDKYMVPKYQPPKLPPQQNRAGPLFKKGLKDGYYVYKSTSGNEYAGQWKDGRRHGYGIAKYKEGEIFHGSWRRGRRHGHGVLHLANTEVFDGDWDSNKKHGLGVYFWVDGEVDISWYEEDSRVESIRWTKDRRRAFQLDLESSKKEQISLVKAATIVKEWERRSEAFEC